MQQITVNRELQLSYPNGFHKMSNDELSRLHFIEAGDGLCLSDPERHMIISIGWKQIGLFVKLLLNPRDLAKNMEARIEKPLQSFGYQLKERLEKTLDGKQAKGIRYTYSAKDIDMMGESYVIRSDKIIYYLNVYFREAMASESLAVWHDSLASVRWI